MNLIKLIAIDLDDTLLHDDISLSEYTKDTLRKAMQKGVRSSCRRCSHLSTSIKTKNMANAMVEATTPMSL